MHSFSGIHKVVRVWYKIHTSNKNTPYRIFQLHWDGVVQLVIYHICTFVFAFNMIFKVWKLNPCYFLLSVCLWVRIAVLSGLQIKIVCYAILTTTDTFFHDGDDTHSQTLFPFISTALFFAKKIASRTMFVISVLCEIGKYTQPL